MSLPETPLFGAIYGNHIEIAKLLLEHNIDTKVKYTGESMINMGAIEFAKERGSLKIAKLIADHEKEIERGRSN